MGTSSRRTSAKNKSRQHKAIRYRVYPTQKQEILFSQTVGCAQKVWNLILSDRNDAWANEHKTIKPTPAQYKDQYPYLREVDSLALANARMDLERAFSSFIQNPKKFRHPKFKSKRKSKHSYTTNNHDGTVRVTGNAIKLPKMGYVKAAIHRETPAEWENAVIKSATFTQERDGSYYISALYEYDNAETPVSEPKTTIGLDYKSDGLYCDSDGNVADMPKFFRKSQKKLAKQQRKLAPKVGSKKGQTKSNNWLKQNRKVNRIHRHIANRRKDYLHKLSTGIANRYDIVCVETLDLQAIANKNRHLDKSTCDNGYGMFLGMLEYKLKDRRKHLVRVDKWFPSSQLCSRCGHQQKLELSDRTYICPECRLIIDRDWNAAVNIRNEGLSVLRSVEYDKCALRQELPEVTPVERV